MLRRTLQQRSQRALDDIPLPGGAAQQEAIDDLARDHIVFVSHTYPDAERINDTVLPALSGIYFDYHFENAKTKSTEIYKPYINRSLNRCKWFLVCVSSKALQSDWMRVEIEIAHQLKSRKNIVCARLDNTEPQSLDVRLQTVATFDVTEDQPSNMGEVERILVS